MHLFVLFSICHSIVSFRPSPQRSLFSVSPLVPAVWNTIHPEPEIHEHIYVTKRLRNNVHDYKHILTYIETNVTNNVNNATHADELTVQH